MCAHFIVIPQDELDRMIVDIKNALKAQKHDSIFSSYEHAYPKSQVPILIKNNNQYTTTLKTWGYPITPSRARWQSDVLFNTKMETALGNKPGMWEESIRTYRCIVPTFGFFEPHKASTHISPKTGKPIKDKYYFHHKDSDVVWLAGIFENDFFSVMTTNPNKWVEDIHRRMPVVLLTNELDLWLEGDYSGLVNRDDVELVSNKVA